MPPIPRPAWPGLWTACRAAGPVLFMQLTSGQLDPRAQRSEIWCNHRLCLATERDPWDAAAGSAAPCPGRRTPAPLSGAARRGEWPVAGVEAQAHQGRRSRVAGGRRFPVQCLFDDGEIATIP